MFEYPADAASPTCIESDVLAAYLDGRLDPSARHGIELHLADCARCEELVTEVRRMQEALSAPPPPSQQRRAPSRWRYFRAAVVALAAGWIVWSSC